LTKSKPVTLKVLINEAGQGSPRVHYGIDRGPVAVIAAPFTVSLFDITESPPQKGFVADPDFRLHDKLTV
jgi:hypothetical protein